MIITVDGIEVRGDERLDALALAIAAIASRGGIAGAGPDGTPGGASLEVVDGPRRRRVVIRPSVEEPRADAATE